MFKSCGMYVSQLSCRMGVGGKGFKENGDRGFGLQQGLLLFFFFAKLSATVPSASGVHCDETSGLDLYGFSLRKSPTFFSTIRLFTVRPLPLHMQQLADASTLSTAYECAQRRPPLLVLFLHMASISEKSVPCHIQGSISLMVVISLH